MSKGSHTYAVQGIAHTPSTCELCTSRGPMHRGPYEPFEAYREGDVVLDDWRGIDGVEIDADNLSGRHFRSLACQRGGLLSPRFAALDHPERWKECEP